MKNWRNWTFLILLVFVLYVAVEKGEWPAFLVGFAFGIAAVIRLEGIERIKGQMAGRRG